MDDLITQMGRVQITSGRSVKIFTGGKMDEIIWEGNALAGAIYVALRIVGEVITKIMKLKVCCSVMLMVQFISVYLTTDCLQVGKGVCQGCILSLCLFNLYAEYIMKNARLDEAQAGIKIAGRNINNLRYADDTTLMAESKEELKSLLMKVKEESEKVGLKLNIPKNKIVASSPITSWQIEGETVADFILGGSKVTADGDCSHEIRRCLLLGRKTMTNLDSILKGRDITLPTQVCIIKAMVFSSSHVWM